MKRKTTTRRRTRRSRTRRQRQHKQKGGAMDCKIILFSKEEPSSKLKGTLTSLLNATFGAGTTVDSGGHYKYQFSELTGLPDDYQSDSTVETVFTIKAPSYLSKPHVFYDTRITALEGQLADAIVDQGLGDHVSLLPLPHGVTDDGASIFYVGLCSPPCWTGYKKGQYQRQITRATSA